MCKIGCRIELEVDGVGKSPKAIIDYIKDIKKFNISYGDKLIYTVTNKNEQKTVYDIKTKSKIDDTVNSGGIYFIFSPEEDKLLYIGKSKKLKDRLKQHLIRCCLSTGSHIKDSIDYLKKRELAGNSLAIKYCVINTEHNKNNAAIEGALIDYVIEHKSEPLFKECWNCRQD